MTPSEQLRRLGIELPALAAKGQYGLASVTGSTVSVSGQGPIDASGSVVLTGTVGADLGVDDARAGARLVAINLLAAAAQTLGSVDRISGVLNLTVYVRATADFTEHVRVADGCSSFFAEIFPGAALPARAAVGVASLPFGIPVEATAVFSIAG
ncbi:MAG: putative translation initiation inhibitor, yjgF family [Blastococcus sp.]|jgi:enamine deaminase RidA (YjgF/YER057c/UK114 family)|nr:putative translation initiation inhibitor, yjgF family [Blastococcus sp.]